MLFKWVDRVIDKKVASSFNFCRKVARRFERTYYTAYKDLLVYTSRRSHDMSVKITMCIIAISSFYIMSGFKRLLHMTLEEHTPTHSEMKEILDTFNARGYITERSSSTGGLGFKATRGDWQVIHEFISQRDK